MEPKIAHLQMVQGVINRMAGNSFLIKGWSVTLVAALFALAAAEANTLFVYLAYFPSIAFWALDAYFLRQERLFRKLYDHVRQVPESDIDFGMNTLPFSPEVASQGKVAFSETLRLFHGTVVASVIIVMVVLIITT